MRDLCGDCDEPMSDEQYRSLLIDRSGAVYSAVADLAAIAGWKHTHTVAGDAVRAVALLLEGLPVKPDDLAEPWPGLSAPQRAAMVALTAGPRLVPELANTCGWSPATAGSVLAALRRRGLAVEVAGLWSRTWAPSCGVRA